MACIIEGDTETYRWSNKGAVMVNRRMFRPGFADVKDQAPPRPTHGNNGPAPSKKPAPPEMTHAENFYWVKQMQAHTPMVVVLDNGEILRGTVEWYDRDCIKLTRQGSPNLLLFKRVIKYVYKDGEESARGGDE
jgi:sRNA-binding regulator protein Hfq